MLDIIVIAEDLAGPVVQLLDQADQGVLVHLRQVREGANFGLNFFWDRHGGYNYIILHRAVTHSDLTFLTDSRTLDEVENKF